MLNCYWNEVYIQARCPEFTRDIYGGSDCKQASSPAPAIGEKDCFGLSGRIFVSKLKGLELTFWPDAQVAYQSSQGTFPRFLLPRPELKNGR